MDGNSIDVIEVCKSSEESTYNNIAYYFNEEKREPEEKQVISVFLSYCQKDKGMAMRLHHSLQNPLMEV